MMYLRFLNKICISIILIYCIFLSKSSIAECIWINKGNGLSGYELTSLAIDKENPKTIYVGSKGFLFKSSDNGEGWKDIFKVPGTNKAVNFISIHPHNPKIIYIATESGVFKSVDGGKNWQAMSLGVKADNIATLLIDSENVKTIFAAGKRDIYVTKDGGKNWRQSSKGLSATNITSMAQNYIDSNILFASAENGLFKTVDGGRTWKRIFSADSAMGEQNPEDEYSEEGEILASTGWVSVDPFNPEIIYLSTTRGIYKSGDNGNSWARLPNIGLSSSRIKNLTFPSYNSGFIFAATENGAFRFSEEENIWREFYSGLTSKETAFISLDGSQDALWLVTKNSVFKSKGGIYKIKETSLEQKAGIIFHNFYNEPAYQEVQDVAIKYAEVHPEKIAKWRRAAKRKALLPRLSFGIDRDSSKGLHWDAGANPDRWVVGPDEEGTGWDITCTWDLGELIWNPDQTSIDVRSKLMVQLRDDVLDEVTHLYFERRRLQVELMQDPPKDISELIEKKIRLQELTADIDAMTGRWFSQEIERRKKN